MTKQKFNVKINVKKKKNVKKISNDFKYGSFFYIPHGFQGKKLDTSESSEICFPPSFEKFS